MFYIGQLTGTRTLGKGIPSIDAGELIHFDPLGVSSKEYFDFTKLEPMEQDQLSIDEIASRFRRAVQRAS